MRDEFEKIKSYFVLAIIYPIVFWLVVKYFYEINIMTLVGIILGEIALYCIYKERIKHYLFLIEKEKQEKKKPQYIIEQNVIKALPKDVERYEYKFVDYSIHDIFDKKSEKKETVYRITKKYCFVYYIDEKGRLLEVKRKREYETILKQSFQRHKNRGNYEEI